MKHHGWLSRDGKLWRVPVFDADYLGPGDELYVGDRLAFPAMTCRRDLLLRVVWAHGYIFRDEKVVGGSVVAQKRAGSYRLSSTIRCVECGCSAVHDVTVADVGKDTPGGLVWTFTRTCRECQHMWFQQGTQLSPLDDLVSSKP